MEMSDGIIGLLIQVPLVGIFVWFTLKVLSLQREERTARDKNWREFITSQTQSFLDFSNKQDEKWRGFLSTEKEQRLATMADAGGELEALAKSIKELFDALRQHEVNSEKRFAALRRTPRKRGKGG
jgi:hypothetical protein